MRRRAGSDRARARAAGGGAAAAAEIGARVFPLPAPAPPPMPAVGARRTTRVFVPKAKPPAAGVGAAPAARRVLRSGKRLAFSGPPTKPSGLAAGDDEDAWVPWAQRRGQNGWHAAEAEHSEASESVDEKVAATEETPQPTTSCAESPAPRCFGIVYTRKRRWQKADAAGADAAAVDAGSSARESSADDRRFGVVYRRRKRSEVVVPLLPKLAIADLSRDFAVKFVFLEGDFLTLLDGDDNVVLAALIDSSCPQSSCRFSRFLASVLRWTRRSSRAKLAEFTVFLLSGGVAGVFSHHGVHFLPLRHRKAISLPGNALLPCGFCVFFGAKKSVLLLRVDFLALPSYFQSLHLSVLLASMYLPAVIRQRVHFFGRVEEMFPRTPRDAGPLLPITAAAEETDDSGKGGSSRAVQDYVPLEQVAGVVVHGLRLKKHQRKRSSSRHPLNRQHPTVRFRVGAVGFKQGVSGSRSEEKPSLSQLEPVVEPAPPKAALEISLDLLDNVDDSDVSTPMGSNGKQKRMALKSPVERVNEKLALAEVRQNIDSVHSKANLLIVQADRCWREEGGEVMLELSDSNEWCITVKTKGITRISHKPSELKLCVVINRYTHSYMWAIDEGWKLEFMERWDWLIFKELHMEGRERNSQSQGKMIPIPGVCEVSDDTEEIVTDPFIRPEPHYIRMMDDEVGRALSADSIYDMDSEDEEWLSQLNPADSDEKGYHLNHISPEEFEKIITTFERDAYNNPGETNDLDQLFARCQDLRRDDMVLAVHDYWIKKRKKKVAPLIRIFQGVRVKRAQQSQRPSVKRKRSFKRQRSKSGRGKSEALLRDSPEEDPSQRVQEAENAARRAVERATLLRNRAQVLMANADLATYKSVMAFRIAEAARVSDSSRDLASSFLDEKE